jgi:hypothetical protein
LLVGLKRNARNRGPAAGVGSIAAGRSGAGERSNVEPNFFPAEKFLGWQRRAENPLKFENKIVRAVF